MIKKDYFKNWFQSNRLKLVYEDVGFAESCEFYISEIEHNESYVLFQRWMAEINSYLANKRKQSLYSDLSSFYALINNIRFYCFIHFLELAKKDLTEIIESDTAYTENEKENITNAIQKISLSTFDALIHDIELVVQHLKLSGLTSLAGPSVSATLLSQYFAMIRNQLEKNSV